MNTDTISTTFDYIQEMNIEKFYTEFTQNTDSTIYIDITEENAIPYNLIKKDSIVESILITSNNDYKCSSVIYGDVGVGKSSIVNLMLSKIQGDNFKLSNYRLIKLNGKELAFNKQMSEAVFKQLLNMYYSNTNTIFIIDDISEIIDSDSVGNIFYAIRQMIKNDSVPFLFIVSNNVKKDFKLHIDIDYVYEYELQEFTKKEMLELIDCNSDLIGEYYGFSKENVVKFLDTLDSYKSIKYPSKLFIFLNNLSEYLNYKVIGNSEKVREVYSELKNVRLEYSKSKLNREYESSIKKMELAEKLEKDIFDICENLSIKISESDVEEALKMTFGNLQKSFKKSLPTLEQELSNRIIGQKNACDALVKNLKKNSIFNISNKTLGVYLLLGASGVGKTELAKSISQISFGGNMVRVDMGEYSEKISVSKLIGAAPGYVGYENGGVLTEALKKNPNSVILLDEIEKAHTDILNIFLNIFDEGYITDSLGEKIDCSQCLIFMTSNLGVQKANDKINGSIGFSHTYIDKSKDFSKIIEGEMKKHFKPELINRMDDIVIFNSLTKEDLKKIFLLNIDILNKNMQEKYGIELECSDEAVDFIVDKSYNVVYGARPLKRYIDNEIKYMLSEKLMDGIDSRTYRLILNDGKTIIV